MRLQRGAVRRFVVAASAGIINPLVAYWPSRITTRNRGMELGIQSAAVSLGLSVGSAAAGLLFGFPGLQGAAFLPLRPRWGSPRLRA
ncbi:hypothetical protein [Mesorhizobium sp.]|uniref:hypothetical protein n=1 Tax=Mesorhizobium sp. TaxID=1871066 RepID=UPI00257AC30D|nr:hypothetical protein [Mesorhizobium sp.]